MRDAFRLLEDREANTKLQSLRTALIDGEESVGRGIKHGINQTRSKKRGWFNLKIRNWVLPVIISVKGTGTGNFTSIAI